MERKYKAVTFNLGDNEIDIVQEFAAMAHDGKASPALRQIIREWARTAPLGKISMTGDPQEVQQ